MNAAISAAAANIGSPAGCACCCRLFLPLGEAGVGYAQEGNTGHNDERRAHPDGHLC